MKWFKHVSESGDDPDIGAIIALFGYKGYYMFFRTIEIMSKEFDIDNPGQNIFNFSWFLGRFPRNIDKKTLIKFLDFTNKIERILYNLDDKEIWLSCPKLKKLTDDYTARVLAGKKIDYGPNWSEQKKKRRARDSYVCQDCGKTTQENRRSLDVHHIISFEIFDNYKEANKLENLISLCIPCHNKRRKQMEAVSTSNSTTLPLSNEEERSKKKEVRRKKEEEKKNKSLVPDDKNHHPKPAKITFNFETSNWENIKPKDMIIWTEAYPACHVINELTKMASWLIANPSKKKSQYKRFINSWLSRQQDRGGTRGIPDEETWAERRSKKEDKNE